jgi:predicted Zn-dependent protease with MMP-like domain
MEICQEAKVMASEDSYGEQDADNEQQSYEEYDTDDEQQPYDEYDTNDEKQAPVEAGQGKQPLAHPLLATLSFLMAAILLITFFSPLLDGLLRMLLLGGGIVAGMLGVLLLEKRSAPANTEQESEQAPTLTDFEQLVQESLASIPVEFREQMENLVVLVENEPDTSLLEELHEQDEAKDGYLLLGLYQGVPLTQQHYYQAHLPERITIYQNTIERYCHGDPERIREQVRSTVLHEVAHHFGIDHDAMPIWVK